MKKMSFKKFVWNWLPSIWSGCMCGLAAYSAISGKKELREFVWIGLFLLLLFVWIRSVKDSNKLFDDLIKTQKRNVSYAIALHYIQNLIIASEDEEQIKAFHKILIDYKIINNSQEDENNIQEDETE